MATAGALKILGNFLATLAANRGKWDQADAIIAILKGAKAFELPCVLMVVFALLGKAAMVRVRLPAGARLSQILTNLLCGQLM